MKKALLFLIAVLLGFLASVELPAQCTPDTVTCVDTTGNPGEVCPADLPNGGLNAVYDETITIIPPGSYLFSGVELTIFHIEIDTVKNLPPGIDYFPNADTLFPDTAYCIQLNGTPTETGVFNLAIYITALVDLGTPVRYQVVDSTSLSITVVDELGLDQRQGTAFRIISNVPNPFSERTRLAFYTPTAEKVNLYVYDILGSRVHHESLLSAPGIHEFGFDGSELPPGTYLYRVRARDQYFTGKFLKTR